MCLWIVQRCASINPPESPCYWGEGGRGGGGVKGQPTVCIGRVCLPLCLMSYTALAASIATVPYPCHAYWPFPYHTTPPIQLAFIPLPVCVSLPSYPYFFTTHDLYAIPPCFSYLLFAILTCLCNAPSVSFGVKRYLVSSCVLISSVMNLDSFSDRPVHCVCPLLFIVS